LARGDALNSGHSSFYFDLADNPYLNADPKAPPNTTGFAVFGRVRLSWPLQAVHSPARPPWCPLSSRPSVQTRHHRLSQSQRLRLRLRLRLKRSGEGLGPNARHPLSDYRAAPASKTCPMRCGG
jgi:hypothetical protein